MKERAIDSHKSDLQAIGFLVPGIIFFAFTLFTSGTEYPLVFALFLALWVLGFVVAIVIWFSDYKQSIRETALSVILGYVVTLIFLLLLIPSSGAQK